MLHLFTYFYLSALSEAKQVLVSLYVFGRVATSKKFIKGQIGQTQYQKGTILKNEKGQLKVKFSSRNFEIASTLKFRTSYSFAHIFPKQSYRSSISKRSKYS